MRKTNVDTKHTNRMESQKPRILVDMSTMLRSWKKAFPPFEPPFEV